MPSTPMCPSERGAHTLCASHKTHNPSFLFFFPSLYFLLSIVTLSFPLSIWPTNLCNRPTQALAGAPPQCRVGVPSLRLTARANCRPAVHPHRHHPVAPRRLTALRQPIARGPPCAASPQACAIVALASFCRVISECCGRRVSSPTIVSL